MPKSLVRVIVFILVPCLLADPITASAFSMSLSPLGAKRIISQPIFNQEALQFTGAGRYPGPKGFFNLRGAFYAALLLAVSFQPKLGLTQAPPAHAHSPSVAQGISQLQREINSGAFNKVFEFQKTKFRIMLELQDMGYDAASIPRGISTRITQKINYLHEIPDTKRFEIVESASAEDLYVLMTEGGGEAFTSTFNGLFNRLTDNLKQQGIGGDELLKRKHDYEFRTFLKLLVSYDRLGEFLDTMPEDAKNSLLSRFAAHLESEDQLGEAMTVADAIYSLQSPGLLQTIRDTLKQEFVRMDAAHNVAGKTIYGLLLAVDYYKHSPKDDSEALIARSYPAVGVRPLSPDMLFDAKGDEIQQYYFYDDEDGKASFGNFLSYYQHDKQWSIQDKGSYVVVRSVRVGGRRVEIYANKPDKEYGAEEIQQNLQQRHQTANIVVIRGHRYHAAPAIRNIGSGVLLVYLAGCGDPENVRRVMDTAPQAQVISTNGTGKKAINDVLLHMITQEILSGRTIHWSELWHDAGNRISDVDFKHYVRPDENTGVIFYRSFRRKVPAPSNKPNTPTEGAVPLDAWLLLIAAASLARLRYVHARKDLVLQPAAAATESKSQSTLYSPLVLTAVVGLMAAGYWSGLAALAGLALLVGWAAWHVFFPSSLKKASLELRSGHIPPQTSPLVGLRKVKVRAMIAGLVLAVSALLFQTGHEPPRSGESSRISRHAISKPAEFQQFNTDLQEYWESYFIPVRGTDQDIRLTSYILHHPEVLGPDYYEDLGTDPWVVGDILARIVNLAPPNQKLAKQTLEAIQERFPNTWLAALAREQSLPIFDESGEVHRERVWSNLEPYVILLQKPHITQIDRDMSLQRIFSILRDLRETYLVYDVANDMRQRLAPIAAGNWLGLNFELWDLEYELATQGPRMELYNRLIDWMQRYQALPEYHLHAHSRHYGTIWIDVEEHLIDTLSMAHLRALNVHSVSEAPLDSARDALTQGLYRLVAQFVTTDMQDGEPHRRFFDAFIHATTRDEANIGTVLRLLEHSRNERIPGQGIEPLFSYLGERINVMHDGGQLQEQHELVHGLSDWTLYRLLANGRELYTSSFLLLHGEVSDRLKRQRITLTQWVTTQDPTQEYLPGFFTSLAQFSELGPALSGSPELRGAFLKMLPAAEVGDLFLLSTAIENLLKEANLSWRLELEQEVCNVAIHAHGRIGLAWRFFVFKEHHLFRSVGVQKVDEVIQLLPEHIRELGPGSRPPYETWFQDGVLRAKLYFRQEEHYRLFLKMFREEHPDTIGGFRTLEEKEKTTIIERHFGSRRVEITATMDLGDIEQSLQDPRYSLIAHRGHSYQLRDTFRTDLSVNRPLMMFLGSCGGARDLPVIMDHYPHGYPFAEETTGVGVINNDFLFYLFEALASGADHDWSWDQIRESIRPHMSQRIREYIFPNDLPALLMQVPSNEPAPLITGQRQTREGGIVYSPLVVTIAAGLIGAGYWSGLAGLAGLAVLLGWWGWSVFKPSIRQNASEARTTNSSRSSTGEGRLRVGVVAAILATGAVLTAGLYHFKIWKYSHTPQSYTIVNTRASPLPNFDQFKADFDFFRLNSYQSPREQEAFDRAVPAMAAYIEKHPEVLQENYHKTLGMNWEEVYGVLDAVAWASYSKGRPAPVLTIVQARFPHSLLAAFAADIETSWPREKPLDQRSVLIWNDIRRYLDLAQQSDTPSAIKDVAYQRIAFLMFNVSLIGKPQAQEMLHQLNLKLKPEVRNTWLELYAEFVEHSAPVLLHELDRGPNQYTDASRTVNEYQWLRQWTERFQNLSAHGIYPLSPLYSRFYMEGFIDAEYEIIDDSFRILKDMREGGHLSPEQWEDQVINLASLSVSWAGVAGRAAMTQVFSNHLSDQARGIPTILSLLDRMHRDPALDMAMEPLITIVGRHINGLHDAGQFQNQHELSHALPDWILYRLVANGRELYTSSFLLLDDQILQRLSAQHLSLTQWIQLQDSSHKHLSGFFLSLGQFQRLGPALTVNPDLRGDFLNALSQADLSDLFLLSDALSDLLRTPSLTWRAELEQRILEVTKKSQGRVGQAWQLYILKERQLFLPTSQEPIDELARGFPQEILKLGGSSEPPYGKLFTQGIMQSKIYFSQQEHYDLFIKSFQSKGSPSFGGYQTVSQTVNTTILEKVVSGQHLRIIATTDFKDVNESLQNPLFGLIAHRGHSYQLRQTFPGDLHVDREFIMALGSCGGFRDLPQLLDDYPNGLPFAVTKTGVGQINNAFLYYLLDGVAQGASNHWNWDQIREFIRPHLQQNIKEFVFPYDLPILMMRVPEPKPVSPVVHGQQGSILPSIGNLPRMLIALVGITMGLLSPSARAQSLAPIVPSGSAVSQQSQLKSDLNPKLQYYLDMVQREPLDAMERISDFIDEPWARQVIEATEQRSPYNMLYVSRNIKKFPWAQNLIVSAAKRAPDAALMFSGQYIDQPYAEKVIRDAAEALAENDPMQALQEASVYADRRWAQQVIEAAARKDPASGLKWANTYLEFPWALPLIEELALNDPRSALNYLFYIEKPLAESRNPAVQILMNIIPKVERDTFQSARSETEIEYSLAITPLTFLDDIVRNHMSYEEALQISRDPGRSYQSILRLLRSLNPLGKTTLERDEKMAALEFVRQMNALHEENDAVRFKSVEGLEPQILYSLMITGEEEVFTSTFNGVFDRMLLRMKQQHLRGDQLMDLAGYDHFRTFVKMAAGFNRLTDFLSTMPMGERRVLLQRFVEGIDQEPSKLEQAVAVADAFSMITDRQTLAILQNSIRREYDRVAQQNDSQGKVIYGLLAGLFGRKAIVNESWLQEMSEKYKLPHILKLPTSGLFNRSGVNVQQYFFYNDSDGIASFKSFLSEYQKDRQWIIEDNGSYVIVRSIGSPRKIEIYANKPEQEEGQKIISETLTKENRQPTVIVHRGHSYHAPHTIDQIPSETQIVYLGSCGGYNNISGVLERAGSAHIISTKGRGTWKVNDRLLKALNAEILRDGTIDWPDFWNRLTKQFNHIGEFSNYIPPHKNIGALFLKAYAELTKKPSTAEPHASVSPNPSEIPVMGYDSHLDKWFVIKNIKPLLKAGAGIVAGVLAIMVLPIFGGGESQAHAAVVHQAVTTAIPVGAIWINILNIWLAGSAFALVSLTVRYMRQHVAVEPFLKPSLDFVLRAA